jgi:transcription initiation factor TFIIIB Brf1 subunit/transcription initiation factor TFIIB
VDSLGSYIDYHNKAYFYDSKGEPLSSYRQALFRRLKYHYDLKSRTQKKETDYNALRVLNRVSALLRLSGNVRNRAAYYYRKVTSEKISAEIGNKLITVSACLFIAIREFKECAPITIQELAEIFRGLGHRVSVRSIVRELPKLQSHLGINIHVRRSEEYLNRIVSSVVTQPEVQQRLYATGISAEEYGFNTSSIALTILKRLSQPARGGRNPFILAVSAVYAADRRLSEIKKTKPVLTQKILAKATGTAEYSLRDHFCSLLKRTLQLDPP